MPDDRFKDALQGEDHVELTVTGRKSGRESSRPIWFAEKDDSLLLLPIHGSDSGWYRNLVKTPKVRLAVKGAELEATASAIDDPDALADTVQRFGEKYGADKVRDYYPKKDVFAEVPLG